MSITIGAIPITRESTAAVVHVVHPLLEAPATKKEDTGILEFFVIFSTTSKARETALVIGNLANHSKSLSLAPFFKNFFHP